jgi:hypothetical protein
MRKSLLHNECERGDLNPYAFRRQILSGGPAPKGEAVQGVTVREDSPAGVPVVTNLVTEPDNFASRLRVRHTAGWTA